MNGPDKINITITRAIHRALMIQGASLGMSPGLYARQILTDKLGIKTSPKRSNRSMS